MNWIADYQALPARDRDEFARIASRLLAATFLVRRGDDRRDFFFVERHQAIFAGYLSMMGWELIVEKVAGVAQAVNHQGGTRVALRLWDSILLLVLRLLYEEKRKQLQLTEDVLCQVQEIHDKCLALRLRERGVVEKTYLRDAFGLFRRFALVGVLDSDVTRPECRFVIYPSVLLAVHAQSLEELHARLEAYGEGGDGGDEDADGDPPGQLALFRERDDPPAG